MYSPFYTQQLEGHVTRTMHLSLTNHDMVLAAMSTEQCPPPSAAEHVVQIDSPTGPIRVMNMDVHTCMYVDR